MTTSFSYDFILFFILIDDNVTWTKYKIISMYYDDAYTDVDIECTELDKVRCSL